MNREPEIIEPHAEWLELSTAALGGEPLTAGERDQLRVHLDQCDQCREAVSEFRLLARDGMPLIADEFVSDEFSAPPGWDAAESKRRLIQRLDQELPGPIEYPVVKSEGRSTSVVVGRVGAGWARSGWIGLAASITLAASFGAFEMGRRSVPRSPNPSSSMASQAASQVESVTKERAELTRRLDQENASLAALEKQTSDRQDEIANLRAQLDSAQSELSVRTVQKNASDQQLQSTSADRDSLAAKLQAVQQAYEADEVRLTNVETRRQQDLLRYASLETETGDLRKRLHEAESKAQDESEYLASDRDIREMMGARQLYIADVVDVDRNGNRRAPFGRVFYTKGKSLVFYAFDLDKQAGVERASTFQAWAHEGSDKARPVSLGIFYVDNEANRRWALKTSDPKLLAEINSVFVTVEPKGGSEKPTGKPLLYAYLQTETPNHP